MKISPDGLTYTFHLREGVTWHDGMPFTANDVSFSFHAALLPEGGSTASGGLKDAIVGAIDYQEGNTETAEGIKVLDDYTIQFELTQPQVTIIERFAMRIAPAHVFEGLEPEDWLQTEFATELPFGTGSLRVQGVHPRSAHHLRAQRELLQGCASPQERRDSILR